MRQARSRARFAHYFFRKIHVGQPNLFSDHDVCNVAVKNTKKQHSSSWLESLILIIIFMCTSQTLWMWRKIRPRKEFAKVKRSSSGGIGSVLSPWQAPPLQISGIPNQQYGDLLPKRPITQEMELRYYRFRLEIILVLLLLPWIISYWIDLFQ